MSDEDLRLAHPVTDQEGVVRGYMIMCPGCKSGHMFDTNHPTQKRNWGFNGDLMKPTFTPSMLVYTGPGRHTEHQCHSFVTDGRIRFLDDCEHDLKGKIVDLEPF